VKAILKGYGVVLVMVAALLIGLAMAPAAMAAKDAPLKIGVVDINKIMQESKAAKNAQAIFLKDLEAKKSILKEKREKVATLEKDLKSTNPKSAAWKEKREKLAQEAKELKRLGSDLDDELKKKNAELTEKIIVDIQQILKTFARSENYSLILEKRTVLAADEGIDVTDKIIELYDSQKK
jgi:outer membrane protein